MATDLHSVLLRAVSPFERGVANLKIRAWRDAGRKNTRPQRTAAVLVPILDKPRPEIVLTVRSRLLKQHPGQVSFPGGQVDQGDRSAVSTALREAEEEIGLQASQVTPLGFLDRLDTISDYRVLPVVGLVKSSFIWQANQREVSEVFTVPLAVAVDPEQYRHEKVQREGQGNVISSLQWQDHRIWGVTAAILLNLGYRMKDSTPGL